MKFQIKGTRKDNGKRATATIEAVTREEAERKASAVLNVDRQPPAPVVVPVALRDPIEPEESEPEAVPDEVAADESNGVAEYEQPEPEPIPYETPAAIARRLNGSNSGVAKLPDYADILAGNRWLKFLASVVAAIGWLIVIIGAILLAGGVWGYMQPASAPTNYGSGFSMPSYKAPLWMELAPGVIAISYGLLWLIGAAAIRLACGMGMAVRDMARIAAAERHDHVYAV